MTNSDDQDRNFERTGHPDVRREFDDRLWNVLGMVGDVPLAPDFLGKLKTQARQQPITRSPLRWAAGFAAVAAAAVLVFMIGRLPDTPVSNRQNATLPSIAAAVDQLSDDDLLAIEIDSLELVNQEWFGG